MLSLRASPFKCIGPKRFDGSLTPIDELPNIDVVLITHNHYDHMDKDTLLALQNKVKAIYVPLDNKKILIKWGIEDSKIKEFDWFEDISFNGVQFSFCPTQHFSGRGLTDRDKYLWGSWAIIGSKKVYVSGDSGYNQHFKLINETYGSFDIACMECGAYNDNWSEIHMMPEESVQASIDLDAKVMLPMHWAGFDLSTHAWDEPITRALGKAQQLGVKTTTPMIGQILNLNEPIKNECWWKN
jgi:L-ascorbate metabolism protein UlaG (beta-lactamase superfamily)